MTYKQVKKYGFRDGLSEGDPEKVIYGQDFDGEFEAIEKAFEAIDPNTDGNVDIGEIDGLQDALNNKADKDHTHDEYLTDAPNDGKQYVRESAAWAEVTIPEAGISEPTADGKPYSRKVEGGQTVGAWVEAPTTDDIEYLDGRIDSIEGNISGGGGFIEAPDDGDDYARNGKSPAWVKTYNAEYIDALEADYKNADAGKADKVHNHAISDVTGLQTALDGKADTGHNHDSDYAPIDHTHTTDEITGLDDKITEIEGDITDLEGAVGSIAGQLAMGGSYNASTGLVVTANLSSFTAGQPLPDYSTVPNTFVIVVEAGNNPEALGEGDWLVAGQSGWVAIKYGTAGSVDWDNISNVPDFDLVYAPIDHTHEIADVDGLQDALDAAGESLWTQNGNDIYYNDGNVGIGIDIPSEKLDVNGAVSIQRTALLKHTSADAFWQVSGGLAQFGTSTSSPVGFFTGNTERVRIDTQGRVGINRESPSSLLHMQSELGSDSELIIQTKSDSDDSVIKLGDNGATDSGRIVYRHSNDSMAFGTARVNRVFIDMSGRVGIGNENPYNKLDIKSSPTSPLSSGESQLSLRNGGGRATYVTFDNDANLTVYNTASGGPNGGDTVFHQVTGEAMRITRQGKVGIGGEPGTRAIDEAKALAKTKLTEWKAEVKKRTAEQPESSTQEITLEVTDGGFGVMPTEQALAEWIQARTIGGGDAKLQVSGNGIAASGIARPATNNGLYMAAEGIIPCGMDFGGTDNVMNIGQPDRRFKDAYFSGTIYGRVADVPDHVKAITPTQIANWDAGTGGGNGGATTDGRISDTQITNWDTAYGWGNHASAGYQPAGNYQPAGDYLTPASLSGYATESWVSNGYQPKGSYLTSSDLSGYATESWVNSQGFAKGSFVPTSGNSTISGTLTATDFIASSDERLKENISPMPVGLIDDIKPVQWTWKDSGKKSAGVIAQQLQEVGLDDFVTEGEDGMLGVNYNALVSVLLAEVISLKKELAK